MRAGAGYVTACVPASLETIFEMRLLEAMTRGLPGRRRRAHRGGRRRRARARRPRRRARRSGPAWAAPTARARSCARSWPRADVAAAARRRRPQRARRATSEALRARARADGPHAARGRARAPARRRLRRRRGAPAAPRRARPRARADAIVVLKGDDTLVAEPDGAVAVSPGARARRSRPPAPATCCRGVIAAMLARGSSRSPRRAPACALHARAGRHAAGRTASTA